MKNNSITTKGYFLKRLRDSGFIAINVFDTYGLHDPRKWTVMVDPGSQSLMITCYENKEYVDDIVFEFNDGGFKFPKNFNLKTESMEVIVTSLIERGILQKVDGCSFVKKA